MFTKGNFEGEYRSRPIVSIRGATKGESKEELLNRAHQERALREAKRNETRALIRIQATVRGFLDRRRIARRILLTDLPGLREEMSRTDPPDVNLLYRAGVLVVLARDTTSMSWLCQAMVKERKRLVGLLETGSDWQFLTCRLAVMALGHLTDSRDSAPATSCLRFLEVYTGRDAYSTARVDAVLGRLYRYLVARGHYFAAVRQLIDARVPPLLGPALKPPTPLAGEILQMVSRPVRVAAHSQDGHLRKEILISFCREIFCPTFTEQVELFILPALCRPEENFPFGVLVTVLEGPSLSVPATPELLYCLLNLAHARLDTLAPPEEESYISLLATLTRNAIVPKIKEEDEDAYMHGDHEDEDMDAEEDSRCNLTLRCINLLNTQPHVANLLRIVERAGGGTAKAAVPAFAASFSGSGPAASSGTRYSVGETVRNLCRVCHQLLMYNSQALHDYALLYSLAFRPSFLRQLWQLIRATSQPSLFGSPTSLLSVIARGIKMSAAERDEIVPPLAVFTSLFRYLLVTIHDTEFYGSALGNVGGGGIEVRKQQQPNWMPFTLSELVPMSLSLRDVALGLVDLAFPESRALPSYLHGEPGSSTRAALDSGGDLDAAVWSHLFKVLVSLVRQLYTRDTRRQFCPSGHWISPRVNLPFDRPQDVSFRRYLMRGYRPFRGLRFFTREELEEKGPPLTTKEVRLATLLRELPFTVAFDERILLFQGLVQRDKQENQIDVSHINRERTVNILVRRNYIYEDAYDKLSPENEPNLRLKMRVHMVNLAGLDEAGVDGGGLFREFLSQLLKAAFDPNRGFFVLTRDQHLYPNPAARHIHSNSNQHYFFIGRMLAKALYENLLVELPLASFFLSKLLGQTLVNVDIDHLDSLDPELYKNLLYLKTYEGDVQDLGLDFTVAVEEFGETRIELLKPEGDTIPVTSENRIEYIHLVADYKLNRQIKSQCNAFRNGLEDILSLDWLRMFSHRELQTLISGAEHDISVEDLKSHTNYGGIYNAEHPTIIAFWEVVGGMTEEEKRSLLRFVTSCSRPPLMGFRDLEPPFCIQYAGSESNRLPTAATCMNLLKLPDFKDAAVLKKKLLYAIESGAGFELS